MKGLSAPLGVWAIYGNHEFHHHNNTSTSLFNKAGFNFLRNHWTELRSGLVLAGLDDLTTIRRRFGQESDLISKALADRPPGATILLSHTSWETEKAEKAGVGLMLCTHTKGKLAFRLFSKMQIPITRREVRGEWYDG